MLGQFITGFYAVEAVTATASFRFGKSMSRWFERSGGRTPRAFLVEGDREGRSLFALANREIDAHLGEVYAGLPPYALGALRRDDRADRRGGVETYSISVAVELNEPSVRNIADSFGPVT